MNYRKLKIHEVRRQVTNRFPEIDTTGFTRNELIEILWRDEQDQGIQPKFHLAEAPQAPSIPFFWKLAKLTVPSGTKVWIGDERVPKLISRRVCTPAKIACSKNGARIARECWMFKAAGRLCRLEPTQMLGVFIKDAKIVTSGNSIGIPSIDAPDLFEN